METRADKGAIFENFFVAELFKKGTLEIFTPEVMFWRTRTGIEIDVIEKKGSVISAYECEWSHTPVSFAKFLKLYPQATTRVVTPVDLL